MSKYDGWTIKSYVGQKAYLIIGYFHETRKEVIKDYEQITEEPWRKVRRQGWLEIVKVRLVEVEDGTD